jgi:hypothetical protein
MRVALALAASCASARVRQEELLLHEREDEERSWMFSGRLERAVRFLWGKTTPFLPRAIVKVKGRAVGEVAY